MGFFFVFIMIIIIFFGVLVIVFIVWSGILFLVDLFCVLFFDGFGNVSLKVGWGLGLGLLE